jgi:hypothetical protein
VVSGGALSRLDCSCSERPPHLLRQIPRHAEERALVGTLGAQVSRIQRAPPLDGDEAQVHAYGVPGSPDGTRHQGVGLEERSEAPQHSLVERP